MTSNYQSNTGHRFISKGKTAFKIAIHTPDDRRIFKSVGFVRIGEKAGLRKTVKLRNKIGKELWGKFWNKVLNDESLLTRLPHSLEPNYRLATDRQEKVCEYTANWMEFDGVKCVKVSRRYSCVKHGKLGAYLKAKKAMLNGCKDYIEILLFMGRINTIDLK